MKLKIFSFMLLVLAMAFTSCKKESTITNSTPIAPVTPNERLLLSVTGMNSNYSCEYNSDKTVKSCTWGGGTLKGSFSYPANKLVIIYYDNNVKNSDYVFELSNGIAQKQTSNNYAINGTIIDTYVNLYSYNAGGQLIKETFTKNAVNCGSVDWGYYNNGDLSGVTGKNQNGILKLQNTYGYNLSLFDKTGSYG